MPISVVDDLIHIPLIIDFLHRLYRVKCLPVDYHVLICFLFLLAARCRRLIQLVL